jgi:hypothetical protein
VKGPGGISSSEGGAWDGDGRAANERFPSDCHVDFLANQLVANSIRPELNSWPEIRDRIRQQGLAEYRELTLDRSFIVGQTKAQTLLGSGYVLCEFLLEPTGIPGKLRDAMARAGALLNLAVVACDRLLESGLSVPEVIPSFEPGLDASEFAIDRLMRCYRKRLAELGLDRRLSLTINEAIRRMFEAEAETVSCSSDLWFRVWLRKSALPFVTMGLPACHAIGYLRWLYDLGCFFGGVDDIADYASDLERNEPNILRTWPDDQRLKFIARLARRGARVLAEWDSLVPRSHEFAPRREIFAYFVWNWIGRAPAASTTR